MNYVRSIIAFAVLVGLFAPVYLKAQESPVVVENERHAVGIGIGVAPDYEGSNDYRGVAAPFLRYNFSGNRYLVLRATELQFNLLDHPFLRFGPSLNYRFGRDHHTTDDTVVKRMTDIDNTLEGGAFLGVELIDRTNPRKRFIASIDFLNDLGSQHDGHLVSLSVQYWYPISKRFDVAVGAGTQYADSNYMDTYFGVSASDAARTGLRRYSADSGIKDYRFTSALMMHVNQSWSAGLQGQYKRLVGDAGDSPIVDDRGSKDQIVGGLLISYRW